MQKRDHLVEIIKQFKKSMERTHLLVESGSYDEALENIDKTFKSIFRLNVNFFNSLSEDDILELIKDSGVLDADKCIILAELLKEEGYVFEKKADINNSLYILTKALNLLLQSFLINPNAELNLYYNDIDSIYTHIQDYEISNEIKEKLFEYFQQIGSYAKAEDTLYELLDTIENNSKIIEKGLKFYSILKHKETLDLIKGGLPLDEVLDGIENLKNLHKL
jgi:tetratricopeptide (TPR) repeat protein